jgi:quercetin dioxygenase-like cupin family protein
LRLFILASLAIAAVALPALAQEVPHVHKQDLHAIDYPSGHQTLMVRTTIDPHATMPPHTHPGIEAGYVLQGTAVLKVDGHPDETVKAGGGFIVPPHALHSVVNTGGTPLVVLTNYVVEAGKPLIDLATK